MVLVRHSALDQRARTPPRWRWLALLAPLCVGPVSCSEDSSTIKLISAADSTVGADSSSTIADTTSTDLTAALDAPDTAPPTTSCGNDGDCSASGGLCDPLTKHCAECIVDAHCPGAAHCKSGTCKAFTPCTAAGECQSAIDSDGTPQPLCDPTSGECVACGSADDCPSHHDCQDHVCTPYTACASSEQCTGGQVCDPDLQRCVACSSDSDCPGNHLCEQHLCRPFAACNSDATCQPLGMFCDVAKGKCAQCLKNSDCPAIYHCQASGVSGTGVCVADVCLAGQSGCTGNATQLCNSAGDALAAPEPCPAQTTCVAASGTAVCQPWGCTPGKSCQDGKLVTCAENGLDVEDIANCPGGQVCVGGACVDHVCEPGQLYCEGTQIKQCGSDGLNGTLVKACGPAQACLKGACTPLICQPNQPSCDGNTATKCKADGLGYLAGGTACGGQVCSAGTCWALQCDPQKPLYCLGNTAMQCGKTGLDKPTVLQTCAADQYCDQGVCQAQICAPNQPACVGGKVGTCNAQGSGPAGQWSDCPAGQVCSKGVCAVAAVCKPGTTGCDGSKTTACKADGSGWLATPCDDGNPCTIDGCDAGKCITTAAPDGNPCIGGSSCAPMQCHTGVCKVGPELLFAKEVMPISIATGQFTDAVALSDGGLAAVGSYGWPAAPWVARFDAGGKQLWSKEAAGSAVASRVASSGDGGLVVLSNMVTKYDAVGKQVWSVPAPPVAGGLAVLADGSVVVAGRAMGGYGCASCCSNSQCGDGMFTSPPYLTKYTASGSQVWQQTFATLQPSNPGSSGTIVDIFAASDGGLLLVTQSSNLNCANYCSLTSSYQAGLLRTDPDGNQLWFKQGLAASPVSRASQAPGGDIVIALSNYGIARFSAAGDKKWYSGSAGLAPLAMADGGALVAGANVLLRLNASGGVMWKVALGNSNPAIKLNAVAAVPGGALAVGGLTGGYLYRSDEWGNVSCAASGACGGKGLADCDDLSPCTADTCSAGNCGHTPLSEGQACGNSLYCKAGACQ